MILKNSFINKSLTDIYGSVYFLDERDFFTEFKKADIIDFYIVLSDKTITIKADSDGESVVVTENDPLKNVDMQESGFIKILKLSSYLKIESYLQLPLLDFKFIKNKQNSVGLLLVFPNERVISIINLGDELHFFKGIPCHLYQDAYDKLE